MATSKIECICLVATNSRAMATFYSKVFDIQFDSEESGGHMIYSGDFSGIEFVLVPVELSGVTTKENKIHFDVYVDDITTTIDLVGENGGRTNGQLVEDDSVKCIAVFDPDDNLIIVKQRI